MAIHPLAPAPILAARSHSGLSPGSVHQIYIVSCHRVHVRLERTVVVWGVIRRPNDSEMETMGMRNPIHKLPQLKRKEVRLEGENRFHHFHCPLAFLQECAREILLPNDLRR